MGFSNFNFINHNTWRIIMELFSGIEYLYIDIANNAGKSAIHKDSNGKPLTLDKLQYEQRLEWFNEVINKASIEWKKE